jgi:hypothetical protein
MCRPKPAKLAKKTNKGGQVTDYTRSDRLRPVQGGQTYGNQALFTSPPNPKYFLFHPSHQIFRHMHGALNVGKKDN